MVRLTGDWEAWLDFFSDAVIATATQAVETAKDLMSLVQKHRLAISQLGRAAESTIAIHTALLEHPVATSKWLVSKSGITATTVNKALVHLEALGIIVELTSQKRNRVYSYADYISIIDRGITSHNDNCRGVARVIDHPVPDTPPGFSVVQYPFQIGYLWAMANWPSLSQTAAEQLIAERGAAGERVADMGWERQQLLQSIVVDSSWERWSGLVGGATVSRLLQGGLFKLRAERYNGPRIAFPNADSSRQEQALRWMGIDPTLLERKIASLSNGEMRRVLYARLWMEQPELLVIDDLYGGLDRHYRQQLDQMLIALSSEGCQIYLMERLHHSSPSFDRQSGVASTASTASTSYQPALRQALPGDKKAPAAGELLANLQQVEISYGNSTILSGFNWELRAGDRTLLVGPNGSGKSSLLALLRADHPQLFRNDVTLWGERPGRGLDVWAHRKRVVLLSPELQMHLSPRSTVKEVVLGGVQQLWDRTRPALWSEELLCRDALQALQIRPWANLRWAHLSPSAQRRVLLARAFAVRPELLLLDETFHALLHHDAEAMHCALLELLPTLPALVWVSHTPQNAPEWLTSKIELQKTTLAQ